MAMRLMTMPTIEKKWSLDPSTYIQDCRDHSSVVLTSVNHRRSFVLVVINAQVTWCI